MPNNFLIVGDDSVEMGTDGVGYTAIGTIVGADRSDDGDMLELKDRKGAVFCVIYFNAFNECSIDVIFSSDATLPDRGDAVDVCGLTDVLVSRIKHKWQNEKERALTIEGKRYPGVALS